MQKDLVALFSCTAGEPQPRLTCHGVINRHVCSSLQQFHPAFKWLITPVVDKIQASVFISATQYRKALPGTRLSPNAGYLYKQGWIISSHQTARANPGFAELCISCKLQLPQKVAAMRSKDDVVLVLGAGDVDRAMEAILAGI